MARVSAMDAVGRNKVKLDYFAHGSTTTTTRRHARIKRHPLLVILLGWVDVTRPLLSAVGALVNIICVVSAVDFVYRAHYLHQNHDLSFSRMGYTTSTSASIVIRAPDSPVVEINARPDFAAPGVQRPLSSMGSHKKPTGTPYVYTTNASHAGSFRTPKQHPKQWTMIQTSCIKPFYPYHPADHALSIKG
ncbi:hypothetical protein MCOR02_000087 [Pyricularia oryzae]|nr:hypothetical protein MCOR02_000087 [Pyricularia oryzae]